MKHQDFPVLAIAVDLIPLQPGGANGGHKPAVFSMLEEVTRQMGEGVAWVFLTNTATHGEVRALARPHDLVVCVDETAGVPYDYERFSSRRDFNLIPRPKDFVAKFGVDLLYCPFGATHFHVEVIPTVAFIADLLHLDYPHSLTSGEISGRETYINHTVKVASMIQCNSRSGVERLIARYQVPEEKLFYSYLPVHVRLETDGPPCKEFVRGLGINRPYFFYPANLWKHKNHETLLLAYRLYREQAGSDAWDLVLTFHEDENCADFHELIKALGIASFVHCPGYVSEIGLRALWHGSGALVFPSLHEGFGIPLVEAMYYGVPILTGLDFSLSEIGGDAALRVDSRKPQSIAGGMMKISSDAELRETLIAKGKLQLNFFDLKVETSKLIDIFRSVPARRNNFPRKPKILEEPYVLAIPTPASNALWTIKVSVNPDWVQNRYSIYLDEAAFGSFSCVDGNPAFSFPCHPISRTLRISISRDRTCAGGKDLMKEGAIHEIVASSPAGEQLVLFKRERLHSV